MENENKEKSPVGKVIALVIGIPLLIWAFPYLMMLLYFIPVNTDPIYEKELPRMVEYAEENPERFAELVEVLTAMKQRIGAIGCNHFEIKLSDPEHKRFRYRDSAVGGVLSKKNDLEIALFRGDMDYMGFLTLKKQEGLAAHEQGYITAEEKAFIFDFFKRLKRYDIQSVESDFSITLSQLARTHLVMVYLPTEEERDAYYEGRAFVENQQEVLPGWWIHINAWPVA